MGKEKKSKAKQTKEDPKDLKGKGESRDKYVPTAEEIAREKRDRQAVRHSPSQPEDTCSPFTSEDGSSFCKLASC